MTTRKTIALTIWTFVGKVMSLLLNMLSSLVITFLPWSKSLLISWLQSPSVVILEPPKIKSDTVSTVSPSISHEVMAVGIRWPKYWHFSISPSNEYSELISLKIDWFVLLGVQGTLRSLLQHNSSKASIVWCSAFLRSSSHSCVWPLGRPQPWLYRPLSAEQCLCFSTHCLSLLSLSRQAIVFWFHGCTHSPQWF